MTPTDAKDETPTPRTDGQIWLTNSGISGAYVTADFARTLERELLAAQTENERLARERAHEREGYETAIAQAYEADRQRERAETAAKVRKRNPR